MLDLLKRATGSTNQRATMPASAEPARIEDHAATIQFRAKSGDPVALGEPSLASDALNELLADLAVGPVEVIEPRDSSFADAAPSLERPVQARQWVDAHAAASPVGRHAVYVLESAGAADLALDTLVCALLDGDPDGDGYPGPDAIVGGYAFRRDQGSGEVVVRPVVGWGGRGARAAAERSATGLVGALVERLATATSADEPAAQEGAESEQDEGEGAVAARACPHCGYDLAHERALFCPKCGMRMRGR